MNMMANKDNKIIEFKNKVSKSFETITVSYHESGHTICALLRFIQVDVVSIKQNEEKQMEGVTGYLSNLDNIQDAELFTYFLNSEIYLYYSGLVAEKILYKKISGSDKFPSFLNGSSLDTQSAAKLITTYHKYSAGPERYKYKKKVTKQLASVLTSYWEDVELVSHFLFRKKRINFKQLKSLLIRKSINKEFWKKQFKSISLLHKIVSKPLDTDKIKIIIGL